MGSPQAVREQFHNRTRVVLNERQNCVLLSVARRRSYNFDIEPPEPVCYRAIVCIRLANAAAWPQHQLSRQLWKELLCALLSVVRATNTSRVVPINSKTSQKARVLDTVWVTGTSLRLFACRHAFLATFPGQCFRISKDASRMGKEKPQRVTCLAYCSMYCTYGRLRGTKTTLSYPSCLSSR